MKIPLFYLFFLLIPVYVSAQYVPGKWTGTLSQPDGSNKFKTEITILQDSKQLSGASREVDTKGNFMEVKFTGTMDDVNFKITETEITKCSEKITWCVKQFTGSFKIDTLHKEWVIEGTWTSDRIYQNKQYYKGSCAPGVFRVTRPFQLNAPVAPPAPAIVKKAIPDNRPLDGYYKKENIKNTKATPLAPLTESNVVYSRRTWREIDLREKKNQYMASPKARLIDALMDAVASGELIAYDPIPTKDDPDGDQFGTPLTPEKAKLKLADSSVMNIIDKKTGDKTGSKLVAGEFNPDSVIRFMIKEDVLFDKQRSVQEYRIIGIAPMVRYKIEGVTAAFSYQPAFWIHFPSARKVLVNKEVVNSRNEAPGLSYDDVFTKRLFSSYIVKESNDKDERIKDHASGIDRLNESEKIKKALMDWELGLWQN